MIPKDILDKLDDVIARRTMKLTNNRDMYTEENLLLTAYCGHPACEPWQIAEVLNTSSGTKEYTGRWVIQTLNKMNLKASDRKQLIETALHIGDLGFQCFNGDKHGFKQFKEYVANPNKHPEQMRCILMALFGNHPQLQALAHAQDILYLGRAYAKYCLLDLIDGAEDLYRERDILGVEEFEQQLARKEAQLRRTQEMLEELQKEFEIHIQESKTQEIANFFATLNSEKYGFILDGLFATKTGLEELKKRRYELPLEINGLTILIRKLIQFVKDSGINPVLRVGEILTVKSQDIENYSYLGSPFEDDRVVKKVQVIAPGWHCKDKDIPVSRPTIKEIKEEEHDVR